MPSNGLPAVSYFKVSFSDHPHDVYGFQAADGLDQKDDAAKKPSENRTGPMHLSPSAHRPKYIRLKQGLIGRESVLMQWCKATLENNLLQPIQTYPLTIGLVNENGDIVADWEVSHAYPVRWRIAGFDESQNEVAIEVAEFSYLKLSRKN